MYNRNDGVKGLRYPTWYRGWEPSMYPVFNKKTGKITHRWSIELNNGEWSRLNPGNYPVFDRQNSYVGYWTDNGFRSV